jgi:hypothetical protein
MKDLAPGIHRQRMVAEFTLRRHVRVADAELFSPRLASAMGMSVLDLDISGKCPLGLAVMCHWDYSGWSLMCWDYPDGTGFASLDLHSCKPFAYVTVTAVIRGHFGPDLLHLVHEPVLPGMARTPASA